MIDVEKINNEYAKYGKGQAFINKLRTSMYSENPQMRKMCNEDCHHIMRSYLKATAEKDKRAKLPLITQPKQQRLF